jgi:pimeloyl-ACP methyl ester carboxylesterase
MQYNLIKNSHSQFTLVFLHGLGCSPDDFRFQTDHFKNMFSILLPDYTQLVISHHLQQPNLFNQCVSEINFCINENAIGNVILIGHAVGGVIALQLTQTMLSERISGCVVVDTSIPFSGEKLKKLQDYLHELQGENAEEVLANFINQRMINHTTDNLDIMLEKQKSMVDMWKQSFPDFTQLALEVTQFDSKAVANCPCPLMYVGGEPTGGDIPKLQSLNPKIQIERLPTGHFVMLNAPTQFNQLLNNFLSANL